MKTYLRILLLLAILILASLKFNDQKKDIIILRWGISEYPSSKIYKKKLSGTSKIAWQSFLLTDNNLKILIDPGISDEKYLKAFEIQSNTTIEELLAKSDVDVESISHLVLTHSHLDHVKNIAIFRNARIYLHKSCFQELWKSTWGKDAIDLIGSKMFEVFENKLKITDNLRLDFIGGHTPDSIILTWKNKNQEYIFMGDLCYFRRTCSAELANYTFNNIRARSLEKKLSNKNVIIIPSHDPDIMDLN